MIDKLLEKIYSVVHPKIFTIIVCVVLAVLLVECDPRS